MILITGATGTIGREVVRLLTEQGRAVRVMTRDPARASGGEVVRADFDDPESLRAAFDGVSAAFLLTAFGTKLRDHDLAMTEAARAAGVGKLVKLSAIGTGESEDPADIRSWHLAGERAVMAGGAAWTVLRPAGFASNSLGWAQAVRAGGPIPNFTGGGAQPVVDPRDVAAVAVVALTSTDHHSRVYTLTGPEILSVPDQVSILAGVLGRPLETLDVPVETARKQMLAAGADPVIAEVAANGWTLQKEGPPLAVSGDLPHVLGRPAGTYAAWAEANRAAFSG